MTDTTDNTAASKSDGQGLWTRPLRVPSRSGNDAQETAILASIHSLDRTRLKRTGSRGDHTKRARSHKTHPSAGGAIISEPSKPVFQLRSLSLDRGAIAPGLARPTAPFARSERKRAYVSAIYYSECFLRNIQPREADLAAYDVQNQYTKWWVKSKKQPPTNSSSKSKRRKLASATLCAEEHASSPDGNSSPPKEIISCDPDMVNVLKERTMELLQKTGGDTTTTEFQCCLEQLLAIYKSQKQHATTPAYSSDGTWLALAKPSFSECQGLNEHGEYLYTLGRMSFDMLQPAQLLCSIRATMNNIRVMDPHSKPRFFPGRLRKELKEHRGSTENPIRHYDVVVAFTIQANQTREGAVPTGDKGEFVIPRPIRGLMTNHGYMVADPNDSNRSSVWFCGGSIEVQDEIADSAVWAQIFNETLVPPSRVLAAQLLLGAHTTTTTNHSSPPGCSSNRFQNPEDSAPAMSYFFKRPIGGHGEVFCETLYMDETLRIMQGHQGSVFVSTKVPALEETRPIPEELLAQN